MLPIATSVSRTRAFLCHACRYQHHACRYQHHNCRAYSSNGQLSTRVQLWSTPARCKAFFSSADHTQYASEMWGSAVICNDKHSRQPADLKRELVRTDMRHLTFSDNTPDNFRQTESYPDILAHTKRVYHPDPRNCSDLKSDVVDSNINETSGRHVEIINYVTHAMKDIWGFEQNSFQTTNEKWVHVIGNMKLNTIPPLTSKFMSKSDHIDRIVQKADLCDIIGNHRLLSKKCGTKSYVSMKMKNLYYLRANSDTKPLLMTFFCVGSKLLNRKSDNFSSRLSMFHCSAKNLFTSYDNHDNSWVVRQLPPWRILFFGTDDIALHTLKDLYANMTIRGSLVETLEVVTVKEQRAVRKFAENVNLTIHEWPIKIETGKYDVGVLVSFGHLIPDSVIHMFPYGILNMHPSLLPRWRGASPIIHTILNGDEVTGVSIMEIRPRHFDIGPLLLQRQCVVPQRCTSLQLADILGRFGASMMLECLKDLPKLERFEHEQDDSGITYAHKLKHCNANIDWMNQTAQEIEYQYLAISELMILKTELAGHSVKLVDVVDSALLTDVSRNIRGFQGDITQATPGTVVYHKRLSCIVVKCRTGLIGFYGVILKKKLSALDFFNGYINKNKSTKFTSLENDLNKYIKVEKICQSNV